MVVDLPSLPCFLLFPWEKMLACSRAFMSCHDFRILVCIVRVAPSLTTKETVRCCQLHLQCGTGKTCTVTSAHLLMSRPKMKPCRPHKWGQLLLPGQRRNFSPNG